MGKIKYDFRLIKYISLFETLTGSKVKDCIDTFPITFVVEENQIAKAIGKNGANVKRLEKVFNRKIKIVEFNPDVLHFTKNIIYPVKINNISIQDKKITINGKDNTTKALLIGRESKNLKILTNIIKRYFDIEQVKVV